MNDGIDRRALLGLGLATAGLAAAATPAQAAATADLIPARATTLKTLAAQLAQAPRRRDFRSVPMILTDPAFWDHEALSLLMAYGGGPKQVWDNTERGDDWLDLMNNALNAQVFSFRHPDFLAVSAAHGPPQFPLFDQVCWDKYGLAKLVGQSASTNALMAEDPTPASALDYDNPDSPHIGDAPTITRMMRRGMVFLACHHAIWVGAVHLHKDGPNPDKLSVEQIAADLTNHLAPGVILTPGMVATIPELQRVGFLYIK